MPQLRTWNMGTNLKESPTSCWKFFLGEVRMEKFDDFTNIWILMRIYGDILMGILWEPGFVNG